MTHSAFRRVLRSSTRKPTALFVSPGDTLTLRHTAGLSTIDRAGVCLGMEDSKYRNILSSLPRLTPAQVTEVSLRLRALGGVKAEEHSSPPPGNGADWMLRAITGELESRGIFRGKPSMTNANRLVPYFGRNAETAFSLLAAGVDGKLSSQESLLLAQVAVRATSDRLRGAITLKRMLQCVHLTPQFFDAAFPGYLAARIARIVLTVGTRHGVNDG